MTKVKVQRATMSSQSIQKNGPIKWVTQLSAHEFRFRCDLLGRFQCTRVKGKKFRDFVFDYQFIQAYSNSSLIWSFTSSRMTIPNLTVNLAGVFEYGQAYVGEY